MRLADAGSVVAVVAIALAAVSCDNPQAPDRAISRGALTANAAAAPAPADPADPAGGKGSGGTTVQLCTVGSDANFNTVPAPGKPVDARSLVDAECQIIFSSAKFPSSKVVITELVPTGSHIDSVLVVSGNKNAADTTKYRNRAQVTVDPSTISYTVTYFNPPPNPTGAWIGVKNSDDVGTRFDFLLEVLKNGDVVTMAEVDNQPSGSSGINNAILRALSAEYDVASQLTPGDVLGVRLSVRVAVSGVGHHSGTARLWYGDGTANSAVDLTVGGVATHSYVTNGFALSSTPGSGPRSAIDVLVDRDANGNAFLPFGTWTLPF